jgi:predicted esterase
MPIKEVKIQVQKTGRYYTAGNPEEATHLIFALHGYGQLAYYFIHPFENQASSNYFIVCPEGLHRFYRQGSNGKVGATWMTKEDRESDIHDYVNYLDQVYQEIVQKYQFEKSTLVGFSQGGATAARWIGLGNATFDNFILWASVFPPDLPFETLRYPSNEKKAKRNFLVLGDQDEYSTIEEAKNHLDFLAAQNISVEFITFKGKHELNIPLLLKLIE